MAPLLFLAAGWLQTVLLLSYIHYFGRGFFETNKGLLALANYSTSFNGNDQHLAPKPCCTIFFFH